MQAGNSDTLETKTSRSWSQLFTELFGRVTSGGTFIPEIDGLRFVAIMSVLFYHTADFLRVKTAGMTFEHRENNLLSWLFLQGNSGVPLFFVISGFILAIPFFKAANEEKKVPLKKFFTRRLTRLEPPYLVNLLIIYALLCIIKQQSPWELMPSLIASMFYVHNITYGRASEINVVAWSLEIEAQFYLLAPFLFMCLTKLNIGSRTFLMLFVMFFTSIARSMGWFDNSSRIQLSLLGKYEYFLTGIILADRYLYNNIKVIEKSYAWDLISICSWCLIPYIWYKHNMNVILPYLTMIAYWGVFRGMILNKILSFLPCVLIGGMCYSIYLYHFLFISLVGNWSIHHLTVSNYYIFLLMQISIISICSILGTSMMFIFLEKPFMRWKLN